LNDTIKQEEIAEQVLKILRERGKKALELTRKMLLEEKFESKEAQEALKYFIIEGWKNTTRPALLSLVCEAVGSDPDITTPIAVSINLIVGGITIHDDIIDQSEKKGDRLTVFGKFGKDVALLVGDALIFKGFNELHTTVEKGVPAEQIAIISNIIKRTFFEVGDAVALELQFRGRADVTPEDYLCVVRKKAADFEACSRIGAIVGKGSKEEVDALGEYGRLLGMLGLLRDDMIDMLDPQEIIHNIKKEHLSLVILYALQNPELHSTISDILKKTVTEKDAEKLSIAADQAGGFVLIDKRMQLLAENALNKIEKIRSNKKVLELLIRGMLLPKWRSYLPPPASPSISDG
jgi:geranylgeranyl diphosphate synthase type I